MAKQFVKGFFKVCYTSFVIVLPVILAGSLWFYMDHNDPVRDQYEWKMQYQSEHGFMP